MFLLLCNLSSMKLKEYYSYKKKFLVDPEIKKKKKSDGVLYVSSTSNNLFISLTNSKGKVAYLKTAGNFGFKTSRDRVSKQAFKVMFRDVIKEILYKKWKVLTIFYKGFKVRNFYLLDYLNQRGLKIISIRNLTRVPYNGCRLKKYPRK